jgi:hypothetical protein
MEAAMRVNANTGARRDRFVLGVHQQKTPEDANAERLLRQLIHEIDSEVKLEVVDDQVEGCSPPWLFASFSFYNGLDQIAAFAEQERKLRR